MAPRQLLTAEVVFEERSATAEVVFDERVGESAVEEVCEERSAVCIGGRGPYYCTDLGGEVSSLDN